MELTHVSFWLRPPQPAPRAQLAVKCGVLPGPMSTPSGLCLQVVKAPNTSRGPLVQLRVSSYHVMAARLQRRGAGPSQPRRPPASPGGSGAGGRPMQPGRRRSIPEQERAELQRRVRAHTTPQRAAKRARVVLLAADGVPNRQIAPMVGMNEHTVAQWRRRFETERLAGLQDRKRPGRPLVYDHDHRLRLVPTVTQEPPDPASHWSHSQLARALADIGISASPIGAG